MRRKFLIWCAFIFVAAAVALAVVGQVIKKGFAVLGNEGVERDERANPVRHPVSDVACDDTAVGVSDQDDVA
jgi:hypothetical protein